MLVLFLPTDDSSGARFSWSPGKRRCVLLFATLLFPFPDVSGAVFGSAVILIVPQSVSFYIVLRTMIGVIIFFIESPDHSTEC